MSVFRPSNINKRLVGTASTLTFGENAGSPGNAGQIGPTKTPYCSKSSCCNVITIGRRFFNGGGCRAGRFKLNESYCGLKECCKCTLTDCGGFFICCGPSTNKWFVAPACTEVSRTWYGREDAVTCANACVGSCGWFVPNCAQLKDPGFCCRNNWDSYCSTFYWTSSESPNNSSFATNMADGDTQTNYGGIQRNSSRCVRAFRCTP